MENAFKSPTHFQIPVPFVAQGKRSVNCGPCSIKMILDYWKVEKAPGSPFSVPSLNRLLQASREWGVEEERIFSFLQHVGLTYHHLGPESTRVMEELHQGRPLLTSFLDEALDGHYAVITGYTLLEGQELQLIFQDPWPEFGASFQRPFSRFKKQLEDIQGLLISVYPNSLSTP